MKIQFWWFSLVLFVISSCSQGSDNLLPIIGNISVVTGDTLYHEIRDFRFVNQDSQWVTNETFAGKAYVADFFFTSCPTICPKVAKQMLRIYQKFEADDRLVLLSHTIDVKRDTVGKLKQYANGLGVLTERWHFVTGNHDTIYDMADDYFSTALVDEEAPGGFNHSGLLILVDDNRHVRSFCDGTSEEEVTRFMKDVEQLLRQEYRQ